MTRRQHHADCLIPKDKAFSLNTRKVCMKRHDVNGLGAWPKPFYVLIGDSAFVVGRDGAAAEAAVKEGHVLGSQHELGQPWALEEHEVPGPAQAA